MHIFSYAIFLFCLYRGGDSIHHLKIFDEGGQFKIGNATFDSMIKLVDYFKQHIIYADTKLKYPINEEILRQKVSSVFLSIVGTMLFNSLFHLIVSHT